MVWEEDEMKRRYIWIYVLCLIVASAFAGCRAEPPMETLGKAMDKTLQIESARQDFSVDMKMDLGGASEQEQQALSLMRNVTLRSEIAYISAGAESAGDFSIHSDGITYEGKIFTQGDKSIMKLPAMDKYLVFDSNGYSKEDIDDMKELSAQLSTIMLETVGEDAITLEKNVAAESPQGSFKGKRISFSMSDTQLKDFVKKAAFLIVENDSFKENMKESIRMQMQMQGEVYSEAEAEKRLREFRDELETGVDQLYKVVQFDSMSVDYVIDKDYNIRSSKMKLKMRVDDPQTSRYVDMTFDMDSNLWDIGEKVKLDIPKVTAENSVDWSEADGFMPPVPEASVQQQ